jgi:peroxiredoxin
MNTKTTAHLYGNKVKNLIEQLEEMIPKEQFEVFNSDAKQLSVIHDSPLKLKTGDKAPLFKLPNANGELVELVNLLAQGAVVLAFYRGAWCPYCNLQLSLLQAALPEITAVGASLVAISPMSPDSSKDSVKTNELTFEVLSDVGNNVAREFTTVFKNSDAAINAMGKLGYDFYSFYDDNSAELPVSGVFVIDKNGDIILAKSEGGDYRERVEVHEVLEALETASK